MKHLKGRYADFLKHANELEYYPTLKNIAITKNQANRKNAK
jgi:hypothetical protein